MLTDGTKNVIEAMKENGVKRLAVVTSIGAGDSENQAPFFFKVLMWTAMKKIFQDKNAQEEVTRQSGLEYCIVRPGGLTVDPPTGVINVIKGEAGSIARADVADFCLAAVTQEDFPYIGQAPCISSVGGTSWTKDRSAAARGETA
jgi:nucleoside-diphosphate-sugar epimerase